MEIARLEVSTQQHLDRMQETAKLNYVQYGQLTKSKKKKPQSSAGATSQGAGSHKGASGHRGTQTQWKIQQKTSSTTCDKYQNTANNKLGIYGSYAVGNWVCDIL